MLALILLCWLSVSAIIFVATGGVWWLAGGVLAAVSFDFIERLLEKVGKNQ